MKNNKKANLVGNIIFYVVIAFFLITGLSARLNNNIPTIFGYSFMHVVSGSMEPTIMTNDIVIGKEVKANDDINVNSIYIYERYDGLKIIHRIIDTDNGEYIFKGDNNANRDFDNILREDIKFKYLFHIPQAGKLLLLLQDWRLYVVIGVLYLAYFIYQIYKTKKQI